MRIIVVGMGKVGNTVAEQLALELHDVTVIDKDEDALNEAVQNYDVIGVEGNGAVCRTLREAGAEDCDLLIALTGSDEVNLLCCLLAKNLGAKSTIARVRNPEYNSEISIIQESLGLARSVNPEKEAAAEIQRIFKVPVARNADVLAKGKMELLSFVVNSDCTLCGKALKDSFAKFKVPSLVCAVERRDDIFIPDGNFTVQEGDIVAALVPTPDVTDFFKHIGLRSSNMNNVMIIGGGRIANYLIKSLLRLNINVTVIERNRAVAEELSYLYPKANIIHGDDTNRSLLLEEGLCESDAVCCLTGIDEENIVLALFAKKVAPDIKVITKIDRTSFEEVTSTLDIGSVIYPKNTTASLILQHVRAAAGKNKVSDVEKLTRIINNKVEAIEFSVSEQSKVINKTLLDLQLKKNTLIGSISRDGKAFIPHGSDMINAGDTVVVITTQRLNDIDDILD